MFRAIIAAVALLMAVPAMPAPPEKPYMLITRATVIDGDTLATGDRKIRLLGIDAPEIGQMCSRDGKPWKCGEQAALALEEMMKGKKIVCKAVDLDRNGLYRSICFLTFADRPKVEDIGARMVRQGWALAYRKDSVAYVDEEDEARKAKRGIWAGEFISPWEWRAQQREGATSAPKPQLR